MMSGWRPMKTVDRASTTGAVLTAAGMGGPTMAGRALPLLPGCRRLKLVKDLFRVNAVTADDHQQTRATFPRSRP